MKITKNIFFFLTMQMFFFVGINSLNAQTESDTQTFNGKKFNIFKIKLDNTSIKNFSFYENNSLIPHKKLTDSISVDDFFITTASIVDSNCLPIGLYVNNKKLFKNIETADGNGNFFLKPNGALLITENDVIVCQTSEIINHQNINYGIQSGPMLVIDGQIHPKFNPNSTNKHIRSAVGKYKNKNGEDFIVFAISEEEVTFFEMAQFFIKQFNCSNALCIESEGSVMSIPYISNFSNENQNIICRYLIYNNQ